MYRSPSNRPDRQSIPAPVDFHPHPPGVARIAANPPSMPEIRSIHDLVIGYRLPMKEPPDHRLFQARLDTPLGAMLAIASGRGLCLLEFVERRALAREIAELQRLFDTTVVPGVSEHLIAADAQLREYFEGRRKAFTVPLDAPGSPFQRSVWWRLQCIPFGRTISYAGIATELDRPGAQRAVGRANGHNRIAIIIPCHRVVRSDGRPGGYGGRLWRKRWLLHHEHSALAGRELAPDMPRNDRSGNLLGTTSR